MYTKEELHAMKYYAQYDKSILLQDIQERTKGTISHIENEFTVIFNTLLYTAPSHYWNHDVYDEVFSNLEKTYNDCTTLQIDEDSYEYFLMGYNAYNQILETYNDLKNFNISFEIKTRLYRMPTYTAIVESCISNFLRFIVRLIGQTTSKDYTKQSQLGSLLQIITSNNYNKINTLLTPNIRNAINHGKVKLLKENNSEKIRFYFNEDGASKQIDLTSFEFDTLIDQTLDIASALLLAITVFLNNHISIVQPATKKSLDFERTAMTLSIPQLICHSLHDTGNNKQLNIEFDVSNTDKNYLNDVICFIFGFIYQRYNQYEQYMISFHHPRMLISFVRLKNAEIVGMLQDAKNIVPIFKNVVARRDYIISPVSEEPIDLNAVKYFCFPNITTATYKINSIQDTSLPDRKRLRAHLFIGDVTKKETILEIIDEGINQLKSVKNPPSPKMALKHGTMDVDSLYIHVYRHDTRRNKELHPSNDNFVCMVDYNLTGETTLKNGGIPQSLWKKFHHEKAGLLQIAWREAKYTPITRVVKIGRNEPCPCNSGKKYKKCCGR